MKKTQQISSREYKVMLDPRLFTDGNSAISELRTDLMRLAGNFGIASKGKLDKTERRVIQFLDTPDSTLLRNHLILRHRALDSDKDAEFTLKCRFEDRYVAFEKNLRPSRELEGMSKFEEDIAAPFRSRYSQSISVPFASTNFPESIGEAAELFPILFALQRDGGTCSPETPLTVVGGFTPHERIFKGLNLLLEPEIPATVAIILWSHNWKSRTICAELSFRYGDKDEQYSATTALQAFELFAAIQRLDCCLPDSRTKTQLVYAAR